MSDINKDDIKLMQSQRLDDTDQGGGQMTSNQVVSGAVNNLFPDISRLDRVYGRVAMRKAYASVQTSDRSTYYGSHIIMTEQVKDPGVAVCFFSSKDWFDTRNSARDRIEAYLVKGPQIKMALWGDHYIGTKILTFFTETDWESPEIGDVMVLISGIDEQYNRIIALESEKRKFSDSGGDFYKKILTISVSNATEKNLIGEEVLRYVSYSSNSLDTVIYDTVAADTSNYYGVSRLSEDAIVGQLQIRIDDIQTQLIPSSASDSAITDAGVGRAASPLIKTNDDTITRQITYNIQTNSTLYIGEGIIPGSLEWSGGGLDISEDSKGNVYNGSEIIGSITYDTGIVFFGNTGFTSSGTATITYNPACTITQISQTGAINIDINNRGFVYTFNCEPLPQRGTTKIDYLAGGKWYSIWDQGNGQISGSDATIGSGIINFDTGSITMTLGAMPDVGSKIIIYWTKPIEYYDLSGETLSLEYTFNTNNEAVTRNTFSVTWENNTVGAFDDGNGVLKYKTWDDVELVWVDTGLISGTIKYTIGEVNLIPHPNGIIPSAQEGFRIKYSYGNPTTESFFAPPRDGNGHITINLTNTPILPKTFRIEWHNYLEEYDPKTRIDADRDPTYIFFDDGLGEFENDIDDGTTNWIKGTINYATGEVTFHPERTSTFPYALYDWVDTEWMHPGVVQTWTFTEISYLPAMSYFPTEGTVYVSFCSSDGANQDDYIVNIEPKFFIKKYQPGMEIIPGGAGIRFGSQYIIDGGNGKLYVHLDGIDGDKTEVGNINYVEKTFSITSDTINIASANVLFCSGSLKIEPMQTMVFRAPGSPLVPGSFFVKGTAGDGTIIQGSSDFSGNITGVGVNGIVDFQTGLCQVAFGEYVTDNAEAQAQNWYNPELASGGVVWKPYSVKASTILINSVIRSYLPLDPDLLKLDPVRLPIDGKVPIFRDGYILVVHHSQEEYMPYPLGAGTELPSDLTRSVGRINVDLIEAYSLPTAAQLNEGTQVVPIYIEETGNYIYDLELGEITFLVGFTYPVDSYGTQNQIVVLSRIEDMCLASDVQITGHIAITNALTHAYPAEETLVSSVFPSQDLQSRAYNEFEQTTWTGVWSDYLIGVQPLASYNFVDYPITIVNRPSIQERWLILFQTSTTISIIGENFGVLAENVSIVSGTNVIGGNICIAIENKQYPGEYYWIMRCDGFGSGWASGNCIRFNTDPANYPLWFIRTTLQAPPTEPIDYYTIQIRGDSS